MRVGHAVCLLHLVRSCCQMSPSVAFVKFLQVIDVNNLHASGCLPARWRAEIQFFYTVCSRVIFMLPAAPFRVPHTMVTLWSRRVINKSRNKSTISFRWSLHFSQIWKRSDVWNKSGTIRTADFKFQTIEKIHTSYLFLYSSYLLLVTLNLYINHREGELSK